MKPRLAFLLLALGALARAGAPGGDLLQVPTRPKVVLPCFLLAPPGPKAVAILLPGDVGKAGLLHDGPRTLLPPKGNFLVRAAERFLSPDLAVAVVDAPSDHPCGVDDAFRLGPEHRADLKALLAFLRARWPGARWAPRARPSAAPWRFWSRGCAPA